MAKPANQEFLTRPTLVDRGWTDSLILKFLQEPDRIAPNPHHKSGPPMKLYAATRVESAELLDEFRCAHASIALKREARKAASRKGGTTRANKTIASIDAIDLPPFEIIERDELTRLAREHHSVVRANYEARCAAREMRQGDSGGGDYWYEPKSPEDRKACEAAFLDRIIVNYLRHQRSQYDRHCLSLKSKIGRDSAYLRLRERVHEQIKQAYPWLAAECDEQLETARMRSM